MRKYIKYLIIAIILSLLFCIPSIYAEENITIESIDLIEKSETTTEESTPTKDGLKIGVDLSFVDVGDYAKYKVVINNTTKKDYEIAKEKEFDANNYLVYTYDFDGENTVKSNSKITMYITITYKNEISTEALTEGKYVSSNELSLSLENKSVVDNIKNKVKTIIKVPITSKSVWLAIILIMIVVIITAVLLLVLSKSSKTKKHVSMILIGLLIIPVVAYAAEKLQISVTTKVTIKPVLGCYTFKNDSSGGGGNANMSGLTLMMKNASQGEDDESWFTDTAANQGQAGVYTRKGTSNDAYPIYYYRGAYGSVNNNLIFNNYCWKIVRTTSSGSVRILYNGPAVNNTCPNQTGTTTMIGNSPFNSSYDDAKYVGYRYDNNGTMTDSNLKMTLDTWYTSNMSSVDSKVETSTYCNDTTTFGEEDYQVYADYAGMTEEQITQMREQAGITAYCPYYRIIKGTPTTKCKQSSDEYSAKVGFLTVDEEMLAGRSVNDGMQDYLYNGSYYWLGSPGGFNDDGARVFIVSRGYWAGRGHVNDSIGVRPVVSLSANLGFTGTGTTTDPFIVD